MAPPRTINAATRRKVRKLHSEGRPVREIADATGISKSSVAKILLEVEDAASAKVDTPPAKVDSAPAAPAPAKAAAKVDTPPPASAIVKIDPNADPLTIARGLLQKHVLDMAELEADSPRLNQAKGEARQLTKLIQALEASAAKEESPEEAERRLRREDGETRREMEVYVLQAETEATRPREGAPHGVCVTCGAPLAIGGAAAPPGTA